MGVSMEELNKLIATIEDDEYIDVCKSDSYFEDDGNYGLILRYLKQNKQLHEKLEKIKIYCKINRPWNDLDGILKIIESESE